jgi:hypothetical protein
LDFLGGDPIQRLPRIDQHRHVCPLYDAVISANHERATENVARLRRHRDQIDFFDSCAICDRGETLDCHGAGD